MKKRKVILSVLVVLFIGVVGAGYYFTYLPKVNAASSRQEFVLEDNQEFLYAKITSISGNEMSYEILEEQTVDVDFRERGNGRNNSAQNVDSRSTNGEKPINDETPFNDRKAANGENQAADEENASNREQSTNTGKSTNGEVPSNNERPTNWEVPSNNERPTNWEAPSNNERPTNWEAPSNNERPTNGQRRDISDEMESTDMQNKIITTYVETGKTGQIQIPVGTDVETKLGTITTFSRLSNGDIIKMLLQKGDSNDKELLKIWIVE